MTSHPHFFCSEPRSGWLTNQLYTLRACQDLRQPLQQLQHLFTNCILDFLEECVSTRSCLSIVCTAIHRYSHVRSRLAKKAGVPREPRLRDSIGTRLNSARQWLRSCQDRVDQTLTPLLCTSLAVLRSAAATLLVHHDTILDGEHSTICRREEFSASLHISRPEIQPFDLMM